MKNTGNLAYNLECDTEKYFDRSDLRIVSGEHTLALAMSEHGLNYNVIKVPHKNAFTGLDTDFFDTYREDTKAILGAGLSSRYNLIQNMDGAGLLADLAKVHSGDIFFARGMTFDGGRVAVAQFDLGDMEIGEGRGGFRDRVRKYLTWSNAHDGSGAGKLFVTPTRIVCANTLTAAVGGSKDATFTIRHTKTAEARMDEARTALKVVDGQLVRTETTFQTMAHTKITNDHIREILADLFPTEGKTKERAGKAREESVNQIKHFINDADGHRIDPDSAWNVYNAITRYNDHVSPVRIHGEDKTDKAASAARTQSVLSGVIAEKNAKALAKIVEVTEIEDDITRLLRQVETSQASQLELYAPTVASNTGFSIFDLEVGK